MCLYLCQNILAGLEKDLKPSLKRDSNINVTAQHIFLAGSAIHEEFTVKPLNETVLKKLG